MSRKFWLVSLFVCASSASALAVPEICGNGVDDNGDFIADEGCYNLSSGQCESPLSCMDTGSISPKKGSLRYSLAPDLAPRVPWGPGIGFRRFYTSQYQPTAGSPVWKTPLGDRWQHTYMTWINTINTDIKVLHTNQGQDVHVLRNGGVIGDWQYYTVQKGIHVEYLRQRISAPNEYNLRLLTGETLVYDSTGRLTEIWDFLFVPNKVLIAYDGAGQVSTVTDAKGTRRLLFTYTSGLLTSVQFQILITGSWTTQQTAGFTYTTNLLATYSANGSLQQTNVYTSGLLTQIQDATAKLIVGFDYATANAGQVVRVDTPRGTVGFDYASARASCSGQTVLYFNKGNATSCNVDGDCGSGFLCGGKTTTGATGRCFRAARCLTVASPNEDLVTTVAPIGPPGESCDGACTEIAQYVWNVVAGSTVPELQALQDPIGDYKVSRVLNANGLPTKITYGDADSDPNNGNSLREVYLYYNNTFHPGRVTEIRRRSDLDSNASSCSAISSTGCASSTYQYNDYGEITSTTQSGTTVTASPLGGLVPYSYVTAFSYDTQHRLTQIDGPLAGATDLVTFQYFSGGTAFTDGFLQNYKSYWDATHFIVTNVLDYNALGYTVAYTDNDTDATHPTGSVTCLTYNLARGYLTERREAMAGQTDCSTANAADLTTTYVRDSALRLIRITNPDGSCVFNEYDALGRLQRTKRRDDCTSANAGDRQEFIYDVDGHVTEIQTYDAANVLTAKQSFTYYDSGRLATVINPVDPTKWAGLTYNARGHVTQVAAAGGLGKTVYHRTGREGRITAIDMFKDPTLFDTWSFTYSWTSRQFTVTDGDGKNTTTYLDDLGRVVSMQSPDFSPTILVYDAADRVISKTEGWFTLQQQTHTFTYDSLGRLLNADYAGTCPTGTPHAEIQRTYDAPPVACPAGMTCSRTGGRLAYVKVSLLCTATQSGTDGSLDQETFYAYDDAGRIIREYVRDDAASPRIANHQYAWTKANALSQVTLPSAAVVGFTYGSATSNSDTERVTAIWRTNTSTPIADAISWYPFGPLKQYNQQHKIGNKLQRTAIGRNLAYRITSVALENQSNGVDNFAVAISEDAKGRVTARDYTGAAAGVQDSFFLYDNQHRILCENATLVGSCPTSGTNLKNNQLGGFTNAGDWLNLLRPIPGSTGFTNQFNPLGYGAAHQVLVVSQNDGTPALGDTTFSYDGRGNRMFDDNTSSLTNDRRDYTYDGRGNVINVHGKYFTGGVWHDYDVASSFDALNRRVFKSFLDNTTGVQAQWFFYYDALDRLTEIRYTPNAASPSTFTVYQLFWLDDRPVLFWQTDSPSNTTTKRYIDTDEMNRPIEMWTWPASGNATRVWAINPSAWGFDKNVLGPTVFQPLLFKGQYQDTDTTALLNDGATTHRPGVVLNGFRTYDPFVGGYIQSDPMVAQTWSTYGYVWSNPVGKSDPSGLMEPRYTRCHMGCMLEGYDSTSCMLDCQMQDSGWGHYGDVGGGGGFCFDVSCQRSTDTPFGPDTWWDTGITDRYPGGWADDTDWLKEQTGLKEPNDVKGPYARVEQCEQICRANGHQACVPTTPKMEEVLDPSIPELIIECDSTGFEICVMVCSQ